MSDIFVTWDRATLQFESSSHIAEGIITLAWHKQQIVTYWIVENVSSTLIVTTGPIKFTAFLIFMNHDAQGPNRRHFEIKILNVIMTFFV